jgi:hypothetical protein
MVAAVAVALVVGVAAVACGGSSSGQDDLCQGVNDLQAALASINNLDPATATADDVQQARYDVTQAGDDIERGAADLNTPEALSVLTATQALDTALGAIAANAPPAHAVQAAQPAATVWNAATAAPLATIGCER